MRRALFCTDYIASSKYFGRAAQTGQAYSSTDRTMLQYTCTSCMIVRLKRAQCVQTLIGLFDYVLYVNVPWKIFRDIDTQELIGQNPFNDRAPNSKGGRGQWAILHEVNGHFFVFL